jgi:acyl-CoA thioester hydrolase
MGANIFESEIIVTADHIDELHHVNNVVYLQWVQDVALAHWETVSQEIREKYNWVALRHEIDYKSPAFLSEILIAKTWVQSFEGVKSIRVVQILRKHDSRLLAEAKSTWCILNSATGKPTKIGEDVKNSIRAQNHN